MLLPPDLALVQRDPALRQLAILLDPEALVALLRRSLPEAQMGGARITYVRYKPGTSCLVGYELEVGGATVDLYARALRLDEPDKLLKARQRPSVPGPLGAGRYVLQAEAIAVAVFPNDDEVKGLARLADAQARTELLRKVVPDQPSHWNGWLHQLRYKPERRYVAQLVTAAGEQALVKAYAEPGYHAAKRNAKAFVSGGPLRLARRLGHSTRYRLVLSEWLPGQVLSEALADPRLDLGAVAAVGPALAALHAQRPKRLVQLTRQAEADAMLALGDDLAIICPELAERVRALARRLAAHLLDLPAMNSPIHGDFSACQVVLADGEVALLDLDEAALGDPAADLGLFIAGLESAVRRGGLSQGRLEAVTEALLTGYEGAARPPTPDRIRLYTATSLFRLAPHAFRDRLPDWPEQTEALLARAEVVLCRQPRPRAAAPSCLDRGPVDKRLAAANDPAMPFLRQALEPREARRQVERCLRGLAGSEDRVQLQGIRVARHKPGRRCLIEYDLVVERRDRPPEAVTLVGKARARGLDVRTYQLFRALWSSGFGAESDDGVSLPEPMGMIPDFQMWLQRKVPGAMATDLLPGPGGVALAGRIAEAIHKLHQAGLSPRRHHTISDELRILHERLALVAQDQPRWAARLERLLDACDRLGRAMPEPQPRGIARDFYADHVVVNGPRLYLLDLDLYCAGDPALDIGNFLGHLTEQSLRTLGHPAALAAQEEALEERFIKLAGEAIRAAVRAYATLTLVRHISLSTQLPERRRFTPALLELCEQRLDGLERPYARIAAGRPAASSERPSPPGRLT